LVAGRKRVPRPAAGKTALRTLASINYQCGAEWADWQQTNCVSPSAVLCINTWEKTLMAYVIAEPCIGTKDTACVDACPVDCIHPKKDEPAYETAELLYIDPVECIDCGACVPVCPVSAIFALDDLPEKWSDFTAKNAAYYGK
jgi:NAD-dependent dihydropyrimidine dehydrogenase PreA subunit